MVKELENLNDFVDGYLISVYEEPEGNVKLGKSEFLEKFRSQLGNVPSNKEGDELVKMLNRGLLRASQLPNDSSLNKRKGFEEALTNVQNKIKTLFNLEDLLTGTLTQYLQDIPKVDLGEPANTEEIESALGMIDPKDIENAESKIRSAAAKIGAKIDRQGDILRHHLNNNGRLLVVSDEGYSDLSEIDKDPLKKLIESNDKSKESLEKMIDMTMKIIRKIAKSKGEDSED